MCIVLFNIINICAKYSHSGPMHFNMSTISYLFPSYYFARNESD